jgi:hypothetical protein
MKKLAAFVALACIALAPAVYAQTAGAFAGKWEGTFTRQQPDGTEAKPQTIVFNLTQKGNVITGTAGPASQQFPVEKGGTVTAGKAKFDVQQPNGPLFKFTLTIVKGHMTGDMEAHRPDGSVGGHAKVDATKAPAKAK